MAGSGSFTGTTANSAIVPDDYMVGGAVAGGELLRCDGGADL